ncbi:MAG: ABC transporter ATP-binding protein [Christensenellales bacterium]
MALLEAEHITRKYEGKEIISDVSLKIERGETVCLIGTSGVGKTTLFQVLSGLKVPDEGRIFLDGKDITGKSGEVGYMLQKDLLLPFLTVEDNVSLPFRILKKSKSEARAAAAPYFERFGLDGSQKKFPCELSGGMKQRAAFMRTYLFGRSVMLLDEPFSALDEITKADIYGWFSDISSKLNLTTLFITHSLDEAITLADRVLVMAGTPGRIAADVKIDGKDAPGFYESEEYREYKRKLKALL